MNEPIERKLPGADPASSTHGGTPGSASSGTKEALRESRDKIKAKAGEMMTEAKDRGEAYLEQQKSRTADRIHGYGETLEDTAQRLERDQDPNIAHYTRMVAEKLEAAATYVRDRDFRELRRDAEDLARRHPAVFFGGMFILGMAAARFFKASAEHESLADEEAGFDPETSDTAGVMGEFTPTESTGGI